MRYIILKPLVLIAVVALSGHMAVAQDSDPRKFDTSGLFHEVKSIVHRYYPEATGTINQYNEISFEHETQMFMVHFPTKTGEWQNPSEVKGPKREGIFVSITVGDGSPPPRAAEGNHFDHCYFTDFIGGYHSESFGAYVNLTVKYPRVYPEEFVNELQTLLLVFNNYVVEKP